jgi:hypothetical protein
MEEKKSILLDKLFNFFNMFGDKKHLMIKYMLDNNIFNESFIESILNNSNFNNSVDVPNFNRIEDIFPFYNTLLDDFDNSGDTPEDISYNLNNKLDEYISKDMFEEAIRLRDYMKKNNIDRIIK